MGLLREKTGDSFHGFPKAPNEKSAKLNEVISYLNDDVMGAFSYCIRLRLIF